MKNLKIIQKIALMLSLLILLNGGVILKLISSMALVNDQSTIITVNWLPSIKVLANINTQTSDFRIAQLQHVGTTEDSIMKDAEAAMAKVQAGLDKDMAAYEKLISSDEERAIWNEFTRLWGAYMQEHKTFLELSRVNRNAEASTMLLGSMKKNFDDASNVLLKDIDLNNKGADDASAEGDRIYAHERQLAIAALGLSLLISVVLGALISIKGISNPLKSLLACLQELAKGNFDVEVTGTERRDEIGGIANAVLGFRQALAEKNERERKAQEEETQKKLARQQRVDHLVREFDAVASSAVSSVAAAATELSQTASDMAAVASQTSQQAGGVAAASNQTSSTVQGVAAAVEEMSASVKEIACQVANSTSIVKEASLEANVATETSNHMLEAARSIGSVAAIIEGIASQINLLALNATIESARAGEAGKGFAVVASEVKSLAGQTTKATEDIRKQLEGVQKMAENVSDALVKLGNSVQKVDGVSSGIAAAVEEQTAVTQEITANMNVAAAGVQQINDNISGIQNATGNTSAATSQILSASSSLSQQAEELSVQVRSFLDAIKAA